MKKRISLLLALFWIAGQVSAQETWAPLPDESQVDICIYGATSAGITAAIETRRQGHSVLLVEPGPRIGGLTAGGLGMTDIGKVEIIQGLALNFYRRVGQVYGSSKPAFLFEPKVALAVYRDMLSEAGIEVYMQRRIRSVRKQGNDIESILLERASKRVGQKRVRIRAMVFIDCSYEGDLMARSGVTYTVGREGDKAYGEEFNGLHVREYHQFPDGVDPYREKGNPRSGLLWGILSGEMGTKGQADRRVQAYNFRLALTDDPANRLPITRPERYDSTHYELLLRWKEVEPWARGVNDCFIWSLMPNHKTDVNNRGAFSTDMIGENWDYPEASYRQRERIRQRHIDYTLGLLYFLSFDARVPDSVRREMQRWGWPRDEYEEHNHMTPQLYVREARRMVGRYVMTQANCQQKTTVEDVIGWAAYTMDSHNTGRYVVNGMVKNEGDVEIGIPGKYPISYRSLTPQESEARNLLVPVCLSASHIAYGSIRMEPVFMVLGQTSALAACQAIERHDGCVQRVETKQVMERLRE
ncbi:MAG: FAD-dependent oxidoreductase [Bacteroidaceae bacterium]|nr:FAD-dependent oxidoreductase [Bacteroidaceae bacterium]